MSGAAATKVTRAFIDRIEGTIAVLSLEGATAELPVALLPEGTREGAWIEITVGVVAPPDEAAAGEALRARLAADDDGGDFKL
jgi:hypothetical protein